MKIRQPLIINIPVPTQFQNNWEPIVHTWILKYNDLYPDHIIEFVNPQITYYNREDGESMMEGNIEITMTSLIDARTTDSLPL